MIIWIRKQADEENRDPTPFNSLTPDLLRPFNLAGRKVADGYKAVQILMIDDWKLGAGNYCQVNTLRHCCGIQDWNMYSTETLVWAAVPSKAIIARWRWSDLEASGIFRVLPALNRVSVDRNLASLRSDLKQDMGCFNPAVLTWILNSLGLRPSSIYLRQVFFFFLGSVKGRRVEKELNRIEGTLLRCCRADVKKHNEFAYGLAVSKTQQLPCAKLQDWQSRREREEIFGWASFESHDHSSYGIKGRMRDHGLTVCNDGRLHVRVAQVASEVS